MLKEKSLLLKNTSKPLNAFTKKNGSFKDLLPELQGGNGPSTLELKIPSTCLSSFKEMPKQTTLITTPISLKPLDLMANRIANSALASLNTVAKIFLSTNTAMMMKKNTPSHKWEII